MARETCWTLLRAASAGDPDARDAFARLYEGPVQAYLGHRWRRTARVADLADARQEVFLECIKPGGVLERADPAQGGFRALLLGVVRNVARRFEERAASEQGLLAGQSVHLDDLPDGADALSRVFDRAWAQAILREAGRRHEAAARAADDEAYRTRFEILRMRHQDGLPVREIAARLGRTDVERVHNDYRRARREYRAHLREAVAMQTGAPPDRVDDECRRVLEMLQG